MTDNITISRAVVEQAMVAWIRGCPPDCKDGMTDSGGVHPWGEAALIQCPACQAVEALRAALEQPQVEQEPLLWYDPETWAIWKPEDVAGFQSIWGLVPLYTHPQPRQPLTDEQIDTLEWSVPQPGEDGAYLAQRRNVRAVKRAHEIGGEA